MLKCTDTCNLLRAVLCLVTQLCPTLCKPMDSSLPGSSVHGISQARILEWATISFSRVSSWPKDRTRVSCGSCIVGGILYPLSHQGSSLRRGGIWLNRSYESERGEWKSWLKAQHSENEDHGIWSHHFMGNRRENSGNTVRLYFWGLQNHCRWWLQPWN